MLLWLLLMISIIPIMISILCRMRMLSRAWRWS